MQRISQKQIKEEFYNRCNVLEIPNESNNILRVKTGLKKGYYKTGFLRLQSAYNGLQLQYVCCSTSCYSLTSGFESGREFLEKLYNIDIKKQYDYYKKLDIEDQKRRIEKRCLK